MAELILGLSVAAALLMLAVMSLIERAWSRDDDIYPDPDKQPRRRRPF